MNEYISFKPQDAQLPGYIRFSLTKKAFTNISSSPGKAISKLVEFSKSKVLLITLGKDKEVYNVFTNEGIFLCRRSEDDNAMVILSFHKSNLMNQNKAMKQGICFKVTDGIIIQIKFSHLFDYYFDIVNGTTYKDNAFIGKNVTLSVRLIADKIKESQKVDDNEVDIIDEEYQPEKKLLSLLQLSESYSILSDELEKKKANLIGKVPYISISSIEYDRIDRIAYQFGINKIDENVFKVGVQVEIEDKNQIMHSAEIIELVKEDQDAPATSINLLFVEHIDISDFNQSGWFNLSFSSVNKDVQLAANERIKNGEATAKYMDLIFGKNQSAGFDNVDLSDVKAELMKKKYPPNESQMNAIASGINVKDVFLVMGPPGTGKTTVILEWVKYFVKNGKHVLVSSQNNKAVDNVLARIADEKYIDIIRVGTESKLQSEVIPYMFENKVTSLRRNITINSEEKIRTIEKNISEWRMYNETVEKAISLTVEAKTAKEYFRKKIIQELLPTYYQLRKLLNDHSQIQEKKKICISNINKLKEKIEKYENSTNVIIKFFTKRGYNRNQVLIAKEIKSFEEEKEREYLVVSEYNRLFYDFTGQFERTKNTLFFDLLEKVETERSAINTLNIMPEKDLSDIWMLFDKCRKQNILTADDCVRQQEIVSNAISRAEELSNVIKLWKQEIEEQQNYALNEIVLESVDLVGATCIGINSQKRFANLNFDVTIIDEAGQIQVHNALVPMSVSNKLIMLGDHKQIPPTVDQELIDLCEENGVKTDLLSMSLFEKMYYDLPKENKIMLDTQYRMPGEIADTISEWFYDGEYYSPPFKRNVDSLIPDLSKKSFVIIDTTGEANRYERKIEGAGSNNDMEANIVFDIIENIMEKTQNDLKEIGVISAYKSQVKLIKNKLNQILTKSLVNEMVATLDSYQGQERDIILYSFTKSSDTLPKKRKIGFLNELRRLNVAMTRCKKMLILVGDLEFLGSCEHCERDEEGNLLYNKSEKQFSDFINKMIQDVKLGRGEILSYQEFLERMR